MRELMTQVERWRAAGEDIAMATVVGVRGSSPRSAGARFCVTRSGRMIGSVSGGCVENDVYRRALEVLDAGKPSVSHFAVGDAPELGVALTCGGSIDVLIEAWRDDDVWRGLASAAEEGRPVVLATAVAPERMLGRHLLVSAATAGSIEPSADAQIVEEARELLRAHGEAKTVTLAMGSDSFVVFLEPIAPPTRLFLIGATDTALALSRIAKVIGLHITVLDARAAYADPARFPDADRVVCAWPADVLTPDVLDERSCVVTLAHDPKLDVPALACALRGRTGYVGALGSRKTHEKRKAALREQGFGDADLARIHSPVGLDLGGRAPQEIALAIAAEIVAVRSGRDVAGASISKGTVLDQANPGKGANARGF